MSESGANPDSLPGERIGFRRAASLPGVEVLDAINTAHRFNWFHTEFGVGIPQSWVGELRYRGKQNTVGPGMALCTSPGELSTMPRIHQLGTFNALMFERSAFEGHAAEHELGSNKLEWRIMSGPISPLLNQRFAEFLEVFEPGCGAMELQSSTVELFAAIASELLIGEELLVPKPSSLAVRRMREILHSSEGAKIDLDELATRVGMSRFHALRMFKQRYGLPPHNYRLCTQLAAALPQLRAGRTATEVAAACGFADQSHFGRLFKRFYGLTPGAYARGERPRPTLLTRAERQL